MSEASSDQKGPLARLVAFVTSAKVLGSSLVVLIVFSVSMTRRIDALATVSEVERVIAEHASAASHGGTVTELHAHELRLTALETDIEWIKRTLFETARAVGARPSPPPP